MQYLLSGHSRIEVEITNRKRTGEKHTEIKQYFFFFNFIEL